MMKLRNFYQLISRNARVKLLEVGQVIFSGSVRDIPDDLDDMIVLDFSMNDEGHLTFKVGGTFKIMLNSGHGTSREYMSGLTYKEAISVCNDMDWHLDTGFIWDLSIEKED